MEKNSILLLLIKALSKLLQHHDLLYYIIKYPEDFVVHANDTV